MAKYKFTKDYTAETVVGGVVGIMREYFKKGQIIEGNLVRNNETSEPPNYVITDGTYKYKIPFGGRDGGVLEALEDKNSNSNKLDSKLFSTTNILIGLAIVGIAFYIFKSNK